MTTFERKVYTVKSPDGGMVIDTHHFPVLMVKWVGTVTIELMDRYIETRAPFIAHADKMKTKVMVITDSSRQTVPAATVRKYIAEKGNEIDSKHPSMHSYIVIIPSAIMRGVITAINWVMSEKGVPARTVDSFDSALALARRDYESLGIDMPTIPADYKIPDP